MRYKGLLGQFSREGDVQRFREGEPSEPLPVTKDLSLKGLRRGKLISEKIVAAKRWESGKK